VIPVTPKMRLNYRVIVNYVVRMHARAPAPGRLDGVQQHKMVYKRTCAMHICVCTLPLHCYKQSYTNIHKTHGNLSKVV